MANRNNKQSKIKMPTGDQLMNAGLHLSVLVLAGFAVRGILASLEGSMIVRSIIAIVFVAALLFATFVLIERMKSHN